MKPQHYEDNQPPEAVRHAEPVWLSQAHWKRLLCFVHIPKAAGTSFKNVLWRVYGRGFLTYHRRLSRYSPTRISAKQAQDILAISGHLPYGFHRMFGSWLRRALYRDGIFARREILYVSIVRDPVDRLLSYFHFVRSFPVHRLHAETKDMDCAQFFEYMAAINNHACCNSLQCAMVTGGHGESDMAIEFAERKFFAVASLENINALVSALGARLEWPEVEIAHKNQSPREGSSEADRTLIEQFCSQYCQADALFYRHVAASPLGFVGALAGSGADVTAAAE
ncbi:MAG TPA: sulfotransferase family 2 domain-containing protein [Methyloceanibacter sp.]|nr:sulfotransferase family 2 domain-containing protein [Methyloceanibacter sp.]